MKATALALCLLPGVSWADLRCATASGNYVYLVDEAAQTITFNDHAALPYNVILKPVGAVFGWVNFRVDLTPVTTTGQSYADDASFMLAFGPGDGVVLYDNFTVYMPTVETAFASVEDVMETVLGIPCSAE